MLKDFEMVDPKSEFHWKKKADLAWCVESTPFSLIKFPFFIIHVPPKRETGKKKDRKCYRGPWSNQ